LIFTRGIPTVGNESGNEASGVFGIFPRIFSSCIGPIVCTAFTKDVRTFLSTLNSLKCNTEFVPFWNTEYFDLQSIPSSCKKNTKNNTKNENLTSKSYKLLWVGLLKVGYAGAMTGVGIG